MSGWSEGLAGTVKGSFFKLPPEVDKSKPPGTTPQVPRLFSTIPFSVFSGMEVVYSPNLVWLAIALFVYIVFPYDLEAAKTVQFDWVLYRALINLAVVHSYTGFWELSLYDLKWSKRKFSQETWRTTKQLLHNIFYSTLGILQWTAWEAGFLHLYATGKLPFVSNTEAFTSPGNIARMLFWTAVIPVFRSTHFYFAHRLIHTRFLYKYVHCLHHRNTDIEPFSGICMHPIEHLYYFSCVGPSLYFLMSPFHMLWNGMHSLLSPAASHSGWEDHFQSDQFHYLHHAFFECNYGSSCFPLDNIFGTFRERIGDSKTYQGQGGRPKTEAAASVIKIVQPKGFQEYMLFSAVVMGLGVMAIGNYGSIAEYPRLVAGFIAFSPLLFGLFLITIQGDSMSMLWPFHKDSIVGSLGTHMVVGFLLAVLPVYHLFEALLLPTSESVYCQLWGC